MGAMFAAMFSDYDFWVNFTSNMLAGVILALVFGLVVTSVMSHFGHLPGMSRPVIAANPCELCYLLLHQIPIHRECS